MEIEEHKIRNQQITVLAKEGKLTLKDIGIMFNLSNQRISVIVGKHISSDKRNLIKKKIKDDRFRSAKKLARRLRRLPTYKELKKITGSEVEIRILRGRLLELGFKGPHKYSKEYLLNNLKALAKKIGRTPGLLDIATDGTVSYPPYLKHFGKISKAQKAAGLVPNKSGQNFGMNARLSDEYMLEHLRELAIKLRRIPRTSDINANGKIHCTAYIRHFGSLKKARKKAGLFW